VLPASPQPAPTALLITGLITGLSSTATGTALGERRGQLSIQLVAPRPHMSRMTWISPVLLSLISISWPALRCASMNSYSAIARLTRSVLDRLVWS